ncbi:hypothetical protein BLGI_4457 [Brevibacillus laterosporus GI-9]|nr:hypothetical protein BLGI_4457 [Brevibacillus laterosporus GI-9]
MRWSNGQPTGVRISVVGLADGTMQIKWEATTVQSGFMHVVYGGNGTTPVDSGLPRVGEIFGMERNGNLRWYTYNGNGEHHPDGSGRWQPNSGNTIGRGW